jgi:hypothetical protein
VAGPPTKSRARAGSEDSVDDSTVAAHAMAVPVHRAGRHSGSAEKLSRCRFSRIALRENSHSDKGARNLEAAAPPEGPVAFGSPLGW